MYRHVYKKEIECQFSFDNEPVARQWLNTHPNRDHDNRKPEEQKSSGSMGFKICQTNPEWREYQREDVYRREVLMGDRT